MSFFKGFKYAFCGIIRCIKNERNMRTHTVAALYVLIFARFFNFSRGEFALLLLTIGAVMAAEAVNTSIEELCNKVCTRRDERIKRSKDAAAGAVLILAIFAALIGVTLFSDPTGWKAAFDFFTGSVWHLAGLILLTVLSLAFIIFVPRKTRVNKDEKEGK